MKNNFFFMVIASGLLLVLSCNKSMNVDQAFQDTSTREQIFEKIVSDHELMTDFMGVMMNNEHAMMMMKGDQKMMGMMMEKGNMMKMMKDKPEMMHSMMGDMIKDGEMMGQMMGMMNKEGMMSDECMKTCMKMMDNKGMNMDMNNNETGNREQPDHESHH